MWHGLFAFYKKYDFLTNEKLCEVQDEMLKDIIGFCDKFKSVMPSLEQQKERAKKQKFLFPQFFRPVEIEAYGKIHTIFEGALRKKGWKDRN